MSGMRQIEEPDATGETAALYADIRATLRASFVPTVLRALAVHPAYLHPAWRALRTGLATMEAEAAARRLRLACSERLECRPPADATAAGGDSAGLPPSAVAEIRAVLETFAHVIPRAFVLVTGLREAWEGRPLTGGTHAAPGVPIARGVPADMPPIPLLPREPADPRLRRIFAAAGTVLGRPAVPSLYRTLGRWPDYLERVWRGIADPDDLAWIRGELPAVTAAARRLSHVLPVSLTADRTSTEGAVGGGCGRGDRGGSDRLSADDAGDALPDPAAPFPARRRPARGALAPGAGRLSLRPAGRWAILAADLQSTDPQGGGAPCSIS
jgi:hypothetical protein